MSFTSINLIIFVIMSITTIFSPLFTMAQADDQSPAAAPRPPLVARLMHHESDDYAAYLRNASAFELVNMRSPLEVGEARGFVALLEVGEQRVEQLLYVDTGSTLLWVSCAPAGNNERTPIYNPENSSTYFKERCLTTEECPQIGIKGLYCTEFNECFYSVRYLDGSYSLGHLAKETFRFGVGPYGKVDLDEILFGCSQSSKLSANGILGLGVGPYSFLEQRWEFRFSICIGNLSDRSYKFNTLMIGDGIEMGGIKTPLIAEDKRLIVTLEGINVDDELLNIDSNVFIRNSNNHTGGLVIDTGAALTFLPQVAVRKLEERIIDEIDLNTDYSLPRNYLILYRGTNGVYNRLCYDGVLSDLDGLFTVKFIFKGNLSVQLTTENMFEQHTSGRTLCLSILPSEIQGLPHGLLGNRMMQFHQIVFDLNTDELSFDAMSCSDLQ